MSTSKKETNGGKGSGRRKRTVSQKTYTDSWDQIFGKGPLGPILIMIEVMRKKGISDEAIEAEIIKEYGERITVAELRELME